MLQAEIKMTIRQTPHSKTIPIRLTLSNESGYFLDMHLYREITDKLTGQVRMECWSEVVLLEGGVVFFMVSVFFVFSPVIVLFSLLGISSFSFFLFVVLYIFFVGLVQGSFFFFIFCLF